MRSSGLRAQWLVWSTSGAALISVVVILWLLWLAKGGPTTGYGGLAGNLLLPIIVLGLAAVGWLIGTRQPANPIGLLFSASAVVTGLATVAGESHTVLGDWFNSWGLPLALVPLLVVLPLIFPDGTLLSTRWRPVLGAAAFWLVIFTINVSVQPGDLRPGERNPFAIGTSGLLPFFATLVFFPGFILVGLLALVLRYRRGSSDVRHQLKWLIFSVGLYFLTNLIANVLAHVVGVSALWAEVLSIAALLGIPVATLVAVLKYRLYDIDIVISRTLVYGSLAAFITGIYVAIVVGLGSLIGSGGKPNLVLSIVATAIVAVAFQPVRERVQKFANRLVYGRRATPYEVLSQFSERVAESYAADEVLPRMARVLAEGTGALRSGVWLRSGDAVHEAACWPDDSTMTEPVKLVGGALPDMPGANRAVEVRHQGELLGALTVSKRPGESLTPVEENLVDDLASQAGLVLKNVGLTDELLQRLDDLRASRQRLVAAQDDERRRLERNLHDGAQQNLVALKVKLGLVEMLSDKGAAKSRALLSELQADADEALETLRSLARGIYPPLLADRGLKAALESQARKATLPVAVEADGLDRYQQEIEAAVYFCCLEALQNVQKYSEAQSAVLKLASSDGVLTFEVTDDGKGFDVASVRRGAGLTNMTDRIHALGGSIEMFSTPGRGTCVNGSLPTRLV
jgi:signal transduction histidine kinase